MRWRLRLARLIAVISLIAVGSAIGLVLVRAARDLQPAGRSAAPIGAVSGADGTGGTGRQGPSPVAAAAPSPEVPASAPPPVAPPSGGPPTTVLRTIQPSATATTSRHVWWIIMENHEYGSIVGNRAAPYIGFLMARYGLATRYYATRHPSEPNYVALVAGSTLGVSSDGVYHLTAPSIFSQLSRAGRSWRVYAQDDPSGCFTGVGARDGRDGPGAAGTYARKHNPAISFTSVAGHPTQCRQIEPLRAFDPAAAPYEMIVPNLTNDMHDGTIGQGDAFLRALVPRILASAAFRTGGALFVTFDEGGTSAGSLGDRGGHVATLIVTPNLRHSFRYTAYADHLSLLRTTEAILGLPCLAGACDRTPMIH